MNNNINENTSWIEENNNFYPDESIMPTYSTFKITLSNKYDSIEFSLVLENLDSEAVATYLESYCAPLKKVIANMGTQYTKVENQNSVSTTNVSASYNTFTNYDLPSEKQRNTLKRAGYTNAQIDNMTKNEASEIIRAILANR